MKVLILGTSNSIMKSGWIKGLKNSIKNLVVDNLSVGASPGIQFGSYLEIDFTQYDYVFLDSVPNDEDYFLNNKKMKNINFSNRILFEICATISNQTKLILMGICDFSNLKEESIVYSSRREIARACGAQYIDFRMLLNELGSHLNGDLDFLYGTSPHPLFFLMSVFGGWIGQSILKTPLKNNIFRHHPYGLKNNFSFMKTALDSEKTKNMNFKNSMLSESFMVLTAESCLFFNSEKTCLGFYVNKEYSQCAVEIVGQDNISQSIYMRGGRNDQKLLKIFVPIPNGLVLKSLKAVQNIDPNSFSPLTFSFKKINTEAIESPILSVSGFLFWNNQFEAEDWQNLECFDVDFYNRILLDLLASSDRLESVNKPDSVIKTAYQHHLYYDPIFNRCIQIDESILGFYPNQLHKVDIVTIEERTHIVTFIKDEPIHLTFFENGLGILDGESLGISLPKLGAKIADWVTMTAYDADHVTFEFAGKFLYASKNFEDGLHFGHTEIINSTLFKLISSPT